MRFVLLLAFVFTSVLSTFAYADTYVNGYTRKDGTYVSPHYRSSPDSSYNNNYSVQGNQNPYTGSYGSNSRTTNDRTPSYNTNTYGNPLYDNSYGSGSIYSK